MRQIYFLLLFSLFVTLTHGQSVSESIQASAVKAYMNSDGPLFFKDNQDAGFFVTDLNGIDVEIPTIFAAGLWIGAKRNNENMLHISKSDYFNEDYFVGPANYSGSFDFNRVWKVTGQEIQAHLNDFQDGTINDIPAVNILEWPAYGNTTLGNDFPSQQFASFFDQDGDGIYDPYKGDYPIISVDLPNTIPLDMAYAVFHDDQEKENSVGVEIHATMYSLDCTEESVYDRSIFTSHRIVNKVGNYDEIQLGYWVDFDIGCFTDDYTGCSPENNAFYAYNKDSSDGDENGNCQFSIPTFDSNPVVHGSKFLNQNMYSSMVVHNAATGTVPPGMADPQTVAEFDNLLNGKWRDGLQMTQGGLGYNIGSTEYVNYLFPDLPTDSDGWSLFTVSPTESDMRSLATAHTGALFSGQSVRLDAVHLVTMDADLDHINKVEKNLDELDLIQIDYSSQFEGLCSNTTSTTNFETGDIEIYPNPASNNLTIVQDENLEKYSIYDVAGREIQNGNLSAETSAINLDVNDGMYWIQFSTGNTLFSAQKFIVINK